MWVLLCAWDLVVSFVAAWGQMRLGSWSGGVGLANLWVFFGGVNPRLVDGRGVGSRWWRISVICWCMGSLDSWDGRVFFAQIGRRYKIRAAA